MSRPPQLPNQINNDKQASSVKNVKVATPNHSETTSSAENFSLLDYYYMSPETIAKVLKSNSNVRWNDHGNTIEKLLFKQDSCSEMHQIHTKDTMNEIKNLDENNNRKAARTSLDSAVDALDEDDEEEVTTAFDNINKDKHKCEKRKFLPSNVGHSVVCASLRSSTQEEDVESGEPSNKYYHGTPSYRTLFNDTAYTSMSDAIDEIVEPSTTSTNGTALDVEEGALVGELNLHPCHQHKKNYEDAKEEDCYSQYDGADERQTTAIAATTYTPEMDQEVPCFIPYYVPSVSLPIVEPKPLITATITNNSTTKNTNKKSKACSLDERWEHMFQKLKKFRDKHGHCSVTSILKSEDPLIDWVKRQRRHYKLYTQKEKSSMTPQRIAKLSSLDFIWNVHSVAWEEQYLCMVQYEKKHGHCNVASHDKENHRLAVWIKRQRRQKKIYDAGEPASISSDRIEKLNRIGFCWRIRKSKREVPITDRNKQLVGTKREIPTTTTTDSEIFTSSRPLKRIKGEQESGCVMSRVSVLASGYGDHK